MNVIVACEATGLYSDASLQNITAQVRWTSSAPSLLQAGLGRRGSWIKGVGTGNARLTATLGSVSEISSINVNPATPVSMMVTPFNYSVRMRSSIPVSAICFFSDNSYIDVTKSATWQSSSGFVELMEELDGSFTGWGRSAGTSTVQASFGGVTGSTLITVTDTPIVMLQVLPRTLSAVLNVFYPFTATGIYSDFTTVDLTQDVVWSSSNGAVGVISNSAGTRGQLSPVGVGSVRVIANYSGLSDYAEITVTNPTLLSMTLSPTTPSIAKGLNQNFVATGNYSDGSQVNVSETATWTSANPTFFSVSNTTGVRGRVSALTVGSANLTAAIGGVSGVTNVTILPAQLVSIAVTPQNANIFIFGTRQFTATGTYTDGTTANITNTVVWTSSNPLAAIISNTPGTQGLAQGLALGSTTITATFGALSGSALLNGL